MATKQDEERHANQEKHARQRRNAVVGKHVIHTLGQPGELFRVQVRQLWQDHSQVNVQVGVDAASAKVAHSYFLVARPTSPPYRKGG
jgi:hypothetical protein